MTVVNVLLNRKGTVVHTIPATTSFQHTAEQLARHRVGALLVIDDGADTNSLRCDDITGIVSERDLVRALAKGTQGTAADMSSTDVVWTEPDTSIGDLAATMTENRIRHVPVRKDGRLAGIVSIGDVVAWHLRELSDTTAALTDYITTGRG